MDFRRAFITQRLVYVMLTRFLGRLLVPCYDNQPSLSFVSRSLTMATKTPLDSKPMEKSIWEKLSQTFLPDHLEIFNESYMHNVPKGSETHFKVVIVSNKFQNTSLLQVHCVISNYLT